MVQIGFIGLGNMGLPMACSLAKAGNIVLAADAKDIAETLLAEGMTKVATNSEAVKASDVVVLMLPNGNIVNQVLDEILPLLSQDCLLIDCSTIDLNDSQKLHETCAAAGISCLDAPVSGGVKAAEAASLTFMVGGESAAFEKGTPYFEAMGARVVHCGKAGSGQAAKVCNNMLLAISMIGTCESFSLGQKLGLEPGVLFDVISNATGSCWSVNSYCPVPGIGPASPADNNYQPGFAASLMLKDLNLAQAASECVKAETPLGSYASKLYEKMVDEGHGNLDFSGIIQFLKTT